MELKDQQYSQVQSQCAPKHHPALSRFFLPMANQPPGEVVDEDGPQQKREIEGVAEGKPDQTGGKQHGDAVPFGSEEVRRQGQGQKEKEKQQIAEGHVCLLSEDHRVSHSAASPS